MTDENESRRDRIIEAIFDALPATDYEEIAKSVSRAMRSQINVGHINNALTHLRRNSAEYGWTVPHVKRGQAQDGIDNGRFFAVLVNREGEYLLDTNPELQDHLRRGAHATVQHGATMLSNEAAALRIAAPATRSINARRRLNELADDFAYIARKAAAVVREMQDEEAA